MAHSRAEEVRLALTDTFDFTTRNGNATTTFSIRVVPLEGNPWFCGPDAGHALGFNLEKGIGRYLRYLGADESRVVNRADTPELIGGEWGRLSKVTLISESGLYKLIMRSDKPQARAFQDWVTKEVLPTIRKTGGLQG